MKHVEKAGSVENAFHTRPVFSEEAPWCLDEEPTHRFADHMRSVYDPQAPVREEPKPRSDEGWY